MNSRPALYERAALPLSYSGVPPRYKRGTNRQIQRANIGGVNALGAQVWHFWLAVPLAIGTVLSIVRLIVNYVSKVVAPRYPKR